MDFFSSEFGARIMESVSVFLAGNNCGLDALMSHGMDAASETGERLLAELRSDPDAAKHKTFESTFVKQLGLYCASRGGVAGFGSKTLPPPPNLLRSFEGMSATSISGILLNARMDSIAGVKDARDVLLGSFSYAFEGICVSDVRTEPKRVGLQAFSGRLSLRMGGVVLCFNGVHWMYRQLTFPFLQVRI